MLVWILDESKRIGRLAYVTQTLDHNKLNCFVYFGESKRIGQLAYADPDFESYIVLFTSVSQSGLVS